MANSDQIVANIVNPNSWMYDPVYNNGRISYQYGYYSDAQVPHGGSSLEDVLRYLQIETREKGEISSRGLMGTMEALLHIVKNQNDKIEELEGMLFDHIEDESDLSGE